MKTVCTFILCVFLGFANAAELTRDGDSMAFVVTVSVINEKLILSSGETKYDSIDKLAKDMNLHYENDSTGPGFYLRCVGNARIEDLEKLGIQIRKALEQHPEYCLLTAIMVVDGKESDIKEQLSKVNY